MSVLTQRFEIRKVAAVSLVFIVELKMLIRAILAAYSWSVLRSVTGKTAHLKVYMHLSLLSN